MEGGGNCPSCAATIHASACWEATPHASLSSPDASSPMRPSRSMRRSRSAEALTASSWRAASSRVACALSPATEALLSARVRAMARARSEKGAGESSSMTPAFSPPLPPLPLLVLVLVASAAAGASTATAVAAAPVSALDVSNRARRSR